MIYKSCDVLLPTFLTFLKSLCRLLCYNHPGMLAFWLLLKYARRHSQAFHFVAQMSLKIKKRLSLTV